MNEAAVWMWVGGFAIGLAVGAGVSVILRLAVIAWRRWRDPRPVIAPEVWARYMSLYRAAQAQTPYPVDREGYCSMLWLEDQMKELQYRAGGSFFCPQARQIPIRHYQWRHAQKILTAAKAVRELVIQELEAQAQMDREMADLQRAAKAKGPPGLRPGENN